MNPVETFKYAVAASKVFCKFYLFIYWNDLKLTQIIFINTSLMGDWPLFDLKVIKTANRSKNKNYSTFWYNGKDSLHLMLYIYYDC